MAAVVVVFALEIAMAIVVAAAMVAVAALMAVRVVTTAVLMPPAVPETTSLIRNRVAVCLILESVPCLALPVDAVEILVSKS